MDNLRYLIIAAGILLCLNFSVLRADASEDAVSYIRSPFSRAEADALSFVKNERPYLQMDSLEANILVYNAIYDIYNGKFASITNTNFPPQNRGGAAWISVRAKLNVIFSLREYKYASSLIQQGAFTSYTPTEAWLAQQRRANGIKDYRVQDFRTQLEELYGLLNQLLDEAKL